MMESTAQIAHIQRETTSEGGFSIDTSFVLFFLAVEFGRSFSGINLESVFLAITLLMVTVLPYFVQSGDRPELGNWLIGRFAILLFALFIGVIFAKSLGTFLPAEYRFVPMTLLIVSAFLSCFIQFNGFLRFRLAK